MKVCKVSDYNLNPEAEESWKKFVEELSRRFQQTHAAPKLPWKKDEYLRFKEKSPIFSYSSFITPMWQRHYDHIEKLMLEDSSVLLQDELVQYAMALSVGAVYQNKQLPYLQTRWGEEELKRLLIENSLFCPYITHEVYQTSETMVNHLTHLTVFSEKMGVDLLNLSSVIEFGGGYGGMARLLRRLNPNMTHIIIDLPLFCFIQECFVRNVYGEGSVKLLLSEEDVIEKGKVNIVPIGNASCLNRLQASKPDLFIATWSLSETTHFTQNYIRERKYFGAQYLLMGYRYYADKINPEQPASNSLSATEDYQFVINEKVFFARDQHYLLAAK